MRMLDLFCGAGGAAMGYARAGFEVVGVDINPQPHYPFEFYQADALTFPLKGFDIIHASPVCKGYTLLNYEGKGKHQKLIPAVKERLIASSLPYVIENVAGAKKELPGALWLCGSMFGLRVWRHRLFESNVFLFSPGKCNHKIPPIGVYGHNVWDSSRRGNTMRTRGGERTKMEWRPASSTQAVAKEAMGIDWMNRDELCQAIPPIYTEWLGMQLLTVLKRVA